MPTLADLLHSIFEGEHPSLYSEFERWARNSRRFRAFVESNRSKIRAKLRNVRDQEALADLSAELEAAAMLVADERFNVQYEVYAASRERGPDFTVTFRTNTSFNVEVRRLRTVEDDQARTARLMGVLCDKAGQMPPGFVNLLWLVTGDDLLSDDDLARAAVALRKRAEGKDEDYFRRRSFAGSAAFLRSYGRLSAAALRRPGGITLWQNPLARHKPPPELMTALGQLRSAY